jgi:hypothetical protein
MSRFPSRRFLSGSLAISSLFLAGCMYQQPMYQPAPYGQQMYGAPGGYSQPGNIVIPQSSAPPYQPGPNTYDSNPKADDFKAEPNPSGDQFFRGDGGVPAPKDSGAGTGTGDEQFNRDLPGL